jgi:hypothetical protein
MEINENAVQGGEDMESARGGSVAGNPIVLSSADNGNEFVGPSLQPPSEKIKVLQVFKLAHGYVTRAVFPDKKPLYSGGEEATPTPPASCPEGTPAVADVKKKSYGPAFWFHNRYFGNPILLYGHQSLDLVDELPHAYQALADSNLNYRFVVAQSKDNYVTLEISQWKNTNRLQLKPHFKSNRAYRHPYHLTQESVDENAWIPAHRSSVNFDPVQDKPGALLQFLLAEGQK